MTGKLFVGARIRVVRAELGLTQAELASRLGISTSYVNQLESNQRPLTAAVMFALARNLHIDLSRMMTDEADRLLADLREVTADSLFGNAKPSLQELKTLATNAPEAARAMLRLYEAYRKTNERLASVDAALANDPSKGSQTAYEEVRDFFHYAGNYIDELDRAAEAMADRIAGHGRRRLESLVDYVGRQLGLSVEFIAPPADDYIREHDRARRLLQLNERLPTSSQYFQLATIVGELTQAPLIRQLLDQANFKTAEARAVCEMGLLNYFAGALHMPYGRFLAAANASSYDLEDLSYLFDASLEQVAHRLSTMQRPAERGVPFFFARVDAAGTITKRHSATHLQFARFGGACPLWNVHRAFEAHGRIIQQLGETPDGNRYLCLAWSSEKRTGGHLGVTRRYAYALGCEISHAGRLVYGRNIDVTKASFDPIGVSCRICERRNCAQRSVPPLIGTIRVSPNRRSLVPYEID